MTKKARTIEISAPDFDLEKTLNSGQVFHWEKMESGFVGTIADRALLVEQRDDTLRVVGANEALVSNYFALDHPLAEICASLPNDLVMNAARDFCRGLRIIRQPKWECLATFICSSMKQVAHIRQISLALRGRFGEARTIENRRRDAPSRSRHGLRGEASRRQLVHTFPSPQRLAASSEKELRECALGYRAKNLLSTARLVAGGAIDLEAISNLNDVDLRDALCALPGVGAKVANCVMLFAYERLRAFPIDVWIARVLRKEYFPRARKLNAHRLRAFSERYFGEYGGYAQQYLFHYARKTGALKWNTTARVPPARNDKGAGVR